MLKLVFAAVATAFLGATASPSKGNDIEVKWLNICRGPIHLFWVAHGGKSEEFISEIPEDHYFSVDTQAGNVFRIKFANDNRGVFGEDVLEEWIIEDVDSPEQVTWLAS